MAIKKCILLFCVFVICSCSEDSDVIVPRNLQEYVNTFGSQDFGNVIAFAASANGTASTVNIFYHPEVGATDIRYYEASSIDIDPNNFAEYRRSNLNIANVFGDKLKRFARSSSEENWCLVTYILNGQLHISEPIRINNVTKPTVYQDDVSITYTSTLNPRFSWEDNAFGDNEIYFQAISNTDDDLISGTFTNDNVFQFYDVSNVVTNLNTETSNELMLDTEYQFTMMDISNDHWVNLVIEENFVPLNLQEYLDVNTVNTTEVISSFAGTANQNDERTFIYFDPPLNSRNFKYYETDSINVDENNLNNYRRKIFTDQVFFGAEMRRFTRDEETESWYIVTYELDGVVFKSNPTRIRNATQPTNWQSEITIDYPESLQPRFSWSTFGTTNEVYLHTILGTSNTFISGVYTQQTSFQFYDTSTTIDTLSDATPPNLILDAQYTCTIFGIGDDNWINLAIQRSFTVE